MGPPRLAGVTPPERVAQEVETFSRYTADAGLVFVDLQLQFLDHLSHRLHGEIGRTLAADHQVVGVVDDGGLQDRKSTRLNSSHQIISYAVFCLKKKKIKHKLGIAHLPAYHFMHFAD